MALALFVARLLGELVGLPGWWAAVALSAVLGLGGAWLLARRPLAQTWPALLLLGYVLYPEAEPRAAVAVLVVAGVCWWLSLAEPQSTLVEDPRITVAVSIALAGGFMALYVSTLAPDVLPADSGELQTVAATLGVAHPPGFPLYTMLAHLMTRLPFGQSPAYQVNLFSALTSVLTLVVVYWTSLRLGRRQLPAITAAIALGTAMTFWAQATTANIRSLTALFTALILLALFEFRRRAATGATGADRWLILAALFFGFGVTHHVSLAFLAPLAMAFVFLADRMLLRAPRRWLWPIVAGLAGLLPLLYLPWRAGSGARGADPDLATWDGFLEHVLARGFSGDFFYFTDPASLWQRTRVLGNIWENQFAPLVLLAIVVALVVVLLHDKLAGLLLAGSVLLFSAVAATYRAPQTVEYLMPAYVAAAVAMGYGLALVAGWLAEDGRAARAVGSLMLAAVFVAAVGQAVALYDSYAFLRAEGSARHVVGDMLADAPEGATILAHWHWATPLWYLQDVEGQRPDVAARFVFPEGEPYEATWARRTRDSVATGAPVITTYYEPAVLADLPPPLPYDEAYLFPQSAVNDLPAGYQPVEARFADGAAAVELAGVWLPDSPPTTGDMTSVTVAWRPAAELAGPVSMSVRLLSADGRTVAQDDRPLVARPDGLTLTQFRLAPRPGVVSGPATLWAAVYAEQPWVAEGGEERLELGATRIESSTHAPVTNRPLSRRVETDDGRQMHLIGYDWDQTVPDAPRLYLHWLTEGGYYSEVRDGAAAGQTGLPAYSGPWGVLRDTWTIDLLDEPAHYVPLAGGITWTGESLPPDTFAPDQTFALDQRLQSDRPLLRDYVISVRLIGLEQDSDLWAWWDLADSVPGLGAFPTLKWVNGSHVLDPHLVTISPEAASGQALTGALTVYDAFTNRPLPVLDERLQAAFAWVPLGEARVD